MGTPAALKVTTHVGRDLLQSSQLFRHEHAVVWEYVSNGLQYKDPGTKPTVVVNIDAKAKKIQIRDNGRGMLFADLQRYFQMHGENLDRKQGRPGRGYFGTGKSAAFGIANSLEITTIRDRRRSQVRLTRQDILAKPGGEEIPVQSLEQEVRTSSPNGTLVEIKDIFLKHIDITSVIRHIERHIAHWPDASVIVNNHECEFTEPDINRKFGSKQKVRNTKNCLAIRGSSSRSLSHPWKRSFVESRSFLVAFGTRRLSQAASASLSPNICSGHLRYQIWRRTKAPFPRLT